MFAGIGYTYNEELDIFLPPKPFESWILNTTLGQWDPPVSRPVVDEDKATIWVEETQSWIVEDRPVIIPQDSETN
jgi:hypothetical protein